MYICLYLICITFCIPFVYSSSRPDKMPQLFSYNSRRFHRALVCTSEVPL